MDDLRRLLIQQACARLTAEYCHLIDHGQAAAVADLFTDDGVWAVANSTTKGRDAIRAAFQKRQDRSDRTSRHVCCNQLVDIHDENNASGVVYLTLYRHDGGPGDAPAPLPGPEMVGEYRDTFRRTRDGWRFARRDALFVFRARQD